MPVLWPHQGTSGCKVERCSPLVSVQVFIKCTHHGPAERTSSISLPTFTVEREQNKCVMNDCTCQSEHMNPRSLHTNYCIVVVDLKTSTTTKSNYLHDVISGKMVNVVFSELTLSRHFVFLPWSFDISFDSHRTFTLLCVCNWLRPTTVIWLVKETTRSLTNVSSKRTLKLMLGTNRRPPLWTTSHLMIMEFL